MSQADNFSDGEFATVIAAAAYAIASLEEKESSQKRRRSVEIYSASLPKTKSRNKDTKIKPSSFHGSFERWFTDHETKEDEKPMGESLTRNSARSEQMNREESRANHSIIEEPSESLTRNSARSEQMNREESRANHSIIEEPMDSTPNAQKAPTLTGVTQNETGSKRVENGKEMRPEPKASVTTRFPTSSSGNRSQDEYSKEQSKAEAEADAWEKEQMMKIKNRYVKMMSMIAEWENEKKEKAKSHLQRKENEPEQIRARALQKYEDEISRIEKVAGDARALAEERRRNDETKARAKAAKIRLTGRVPHTYCCC